MTQTLPPAPSPTAAVPVDMISPVRWVERGWDDLRANPVPGLVHGALITLFGWLLMWAAREKFWLLAGAFSGFLIVAPVLATGLYHVSRERAAGRMAGLGDVLALNGGVPALASTAKALLERIAPDQTPPRRVQDITLDGAGLRPGLSTGVGLANVREQLAARYGTQATCSLAARADGRGVCAEIQLPIGSPA